MRQKIKPKSTMAIAVVLPTSCSGHLLTYSQILLVSDSRQHIRWYGEADAWSAVL